ncbi:MAG: hypothetical protein AAGP08_15755 [Pseudomonadota bacterium]
MADTEKTVPLTHQEMIDRDERRTRAVNFTIGAMAIGLGPLVWVMDRVNGNACFRNSISHYFYEPAAGTVFIMVLTAVAAFMVLYRGEEPPDQIAGFVGGIGCALLALFPTFGVGCPIGTAGAAEIDFRPALIVQTEALRAPQAPRGLVEGIVVTPTPPPSEAAVSVLVAGETTRDLHTFGTALVFLALLYFSIYAFPRSNAPAQDYFEGRAPSGSDPGAFGPTKRFRNKVYYMMSGVMLVAAVLIIVTSWNIIAIPRGVFWGELMFLSAFGLSWLTKSKILWGTPPNVPAKQAA